MSPASVSLASLALALLSRSAICSWWSLDTPSRAGLKIAQWPDNLQRRRSAAPGRPGTLT